MRCLSKALPVVLLAAIACAAPAADVTFNDDIRPILVENCFSCHGADSAGRKADLRRLNRARSCPAIPIRA